jgi:phosphonate metabolism protein (transferase hexapeptide repeat family)
MYTTIESMNQPAAVSLSEQPTIAPDAILKNCRFGRYTEVDEQVRMTDCLFDDYAYIQRHGDLMCTDVGKFANIAAFVRSNPGFHPMERPSMHHFTYRCTMYGFGDQDDEEFFAWRRRQRVTIGRDTWIGHGAVIMPGVTIGAGAVVGSNSVVTKDVAPYAIVAGAPAKFIRWRFAPAIAAALESTGWWDWDHATLRERMPDFKDMRTFLAKYAP